MDLIYPDAGLAILRVATGVFFVTTGARKMFLPEVRGKVMHLFDSHKVPKPAQYAVMTGEFLGGLGLIFGCLTQLAALGLFIIMMGAYVLDTWPGVVKKAEGGGWSKLLSNALCTPEAQLLIIVLSLVFMGGGAYSLDGAL